MASSWLVPLPAALCCLTGTFTRLMALPATLCCQYSPCHTYVPFTGSDTIPAWTCRPSVAFAIPAWTCRPSVASTSPVTCPAMSADVI